MDSRDRPAYMRWWRAQQKTIIPKPVPDLNWPTNLFGQPCRIEDLMAFDTAAPAKSKLPAADKCALAACDKPHNDHAQWTRRDHFGNGWLRDKFCCDVHKSAFIRGGVR